MDDDLSRYLPKLAPPNIVQQLRAWAQGGDGGHCSIMDHAADEILRLQKLCAQYSRQLHQMQPN